MSGLKERLIRYTKPDASRPAAAGTGEEVDYGRSGSDASEANGRSSREADDQLPLSDASNELGDKWERLGASFETNEWGSFIKRRIVYPLGYMHGKYRLGELPPVCGELSAFPDTGVSNAEQIVFFDTETTGLGIGAGNVPFMLGIGFYESDRFVVEQLFIHNLAEELAMLTYLDEKLQAFTHMVSYNGRTFDWPILKNRYILNRLVLRNETLLHLDFLYPSRSLWRTVLPACRLGVVEEERLGFEREEDVPGSQAPVLYVRYLAEGDPDVISGVFIHNENDILSLAALAVHFTYALAGRLKWSEMGAEELYRTALWLDRLDKRELADEAIGRLLSRPEELLLDYWAPVGDLYKRRGKIHEAAHLWQKAVSAKRSSPLRSLDPFVELAMYYEHKRKDFKSALAYAEEAMELARKRTAFNRDSGKESRRAILLRELDKRIGRLRSKLASEALRNGDFPESLSLF